MPELPEVEFARRQLHRWLVGAKVTAVRAPRSLVVEGNARGLVGEKVDALERRGKWLRLAVGEHVVFSHFGMTGRWVKRPVDAEAERFERVRLTVTKKGKSYCAIYADARMLGRFTVRTEDSPSWNALGPDPLRDEIDVDALHTRINRSKRTIKEILMDQTVLAGVGNIQATDSLFLARVLPDRAGTSITAKEARSIVRAIHRSIERTLKHESGPEITYVEDAGAENPFIIYGKHGDPCPRCKTTLVRTILGGRATVHCPSCQR